MASPAIGWATAVAVMLHEIPQELGDFGILVHTGVAPRRALALNFLSGLIALVGAAATLWLLPLESVEQLLVPFSAGAFVYIAEQTSFPSSTRSRSRSSPCFRSWRCLPESESWLLCWWSSRDDS